MESRKINKRTRNYAIRVFMTLVVFLAIASHTSVYADQQAGSEDQLTGCVFSLEKKRIKFAAYQPQINNKSLCQKIPETTGVTYFSLDLVEKSLREQVLMIKVTPISKAGGELQENAIVDFAVSSSPTGVVSFEHDFKGAEGRFRLDVINEMDNTKGSFVFEVGVKEFKWEGKFGQRVAFGFFGFLVILSLLYLSRRNKKAKNS